MKEHILRRAIAMRSVTKSEKGASLVEYSVLLGLISVAVILAVLFQGEAIRDIIGGTAQTIEEKRAEAEAGPEVFDPYETVEQTDWLVGTPSADAELQITNEPGVMGLAGNDVIKGTSSSEGFIGGPGNDTVYGGGGGGSDTFYFAKGDGHDYVSNYSRYSGGDLIKFLDVASTDVTAGRNGENLVLTIDETGDSLELSSFSTPYSRDWIGSYSFTDAPLSSQDMRDKADQDQKATGSVVGAYKTDNYVIRNGEGSYTVSDRGGDDNITFDGLSVQDVDFHSNSNQDLIIELPSGETITYYGTYSGWAYRKIEDFHFADQDMSYADTICKMNEDSKKTGDVYGSDYNDCYTFKSTDPNFTIHESGGTDTIRFIGYNVADLQFYGNSGYGMIFSDIHGPAVTVARGFDGFTYPYIEHYVFDDATLTRQQVIDKMDQDMKIPGYIWGSKSNDHYTMDLGDPSYAYFDYQGTNTLTFPGIRVGDVKFFANSDHDLEAVLPNGNSVTSKKQWFSSGYYKTYRFIFDDATLTNNQAIDKMDVDSKLRGVVYGTPFNDHYTFTSEDGNVSISEKNGNDTITFDKPFSAYAVYFDPNNSVSHLYVKDESTNMVLTVYYQNSSFVYRKIDTFIFMDQTMSATALSAYCNQPLASGGKTCDYDNVNP